MLFMYGQMFFFRLMQVEEEASLILFLAKASNACI